MDADECTLLEEISEVPWGPQRSVFVSVCLDSAAFLVSFLSADCVTMTMQVAICGKEQKRAKREAAVDSRMLNDPTARREVSCKLLAGVLLRAGLFDVAEFVFC